MTGNIAPLNGMPLFGWPDQREIDVLQNRRDQLAERIARLPRFSHRRIELEARLRALTEEQLIISNRITRGRRPHP